MVEISNADRVLFPDEGFTKRDLVEHYLNAGPLIIPHVADRPMTIHRFPSGIGKKGFMQKNAADYFPDNIGRVEIPKRDGGVTVFPIVNDVEGLAYLANLGSITFHVPTSRVSSLDTPDRFLIDLDPDAGDVASVRKAALIVRDVLLGLGLQTTPMTTGSKGYHLVARIRPEIPMDRVSHAAQGLAWLLSDEYPDLMTIEFRKANRDGRVFVDWMRNGHMATGVAAYSVRARPGAPVAVPIAWDELPAIDPDHFRIGTVADRLSTTDPIMDAAEQSAEPFVSAIEEKLEGVELPTFDRFRS